MKKVIIACCIVFIAAQGCSGSGTDQPQGGAGKDQAPTTMSADSSNGYQDKTVQSVDTSKR